MTPAYRAFEPRPKRRNGCWEVDCRPWAAIMADLGEPLRRRFTEEIGGRAAAVEWCRELIAAEATGARRIRQRATVSAYCERFNKSCETRLRPKTIAAYGVELRRWQSWCKAEDVVYLDQVTPSLIEAYHADLIAQGLARSSVSLALRVLSGSFAWGVKMRLIGDNPCRGLVPRAPKSDKRALTDEERETIVNDDGPYRDVWLAYLSTGLRLTELCTLRVDQVVLDTPAPYLDVVGKGAKRRTVPLEGEAVDLFRRLCSGRTEGDTVLPWASKTISQYWREARDRLKLPDDVTPHTFRHDFATYLANLPGVPLTEVRDVLGHSSVTVTEIYVHPDRRAQRRGVAERCAQLRRSARHGTESSTASEGAHHEGA